MAPVDVPGVINSVYATLAQLGSPVEAPVVRQEPAVSIRSSIKPDYIICLEDGNSRYILGRRRLESALAQNEG